MAICGEIQQPLVAVIGFERFGIVWIQSASGQGRKVVFAPLAVLLPVVPHQFYRCIQEKIYFYC
jgi:hypothetical protein